MINILLAVIAAYLIGEEYKIRKPFSLFGWLR